MRQIFLNPRLWIALLVMCAVDLAFQLGAYRSLAARESHSGATIRMLSAMNLRGADQIDSVTIGSSVAVYGLAHQRIAEFAAQRDYVHANLSLPGSALMTFRQWGKYLPKTAPRVKRGIIVLEPNDFLYLGNGSYELAMVTPMKSLSDGLWWNEHVPFNASNLETYGLFSGLASYRLDIQQLIANPRQRRAEIQWWRAYLRSRNTLSANHIVEGQLCSVDLRTRDTCLASTRPIDMDAQRFAALKQSCQEKLEVPEGGVPDWRIPSAVPAQTRRVQQLRRKLFQELGWTQRSLVVVLPMHPLWDQSRALGAAEIMRETYQPLVDQGLLRYVDLRNLFAEAGVPACQGFYDLYHLNGVGQKLVTDRLLDELAWMYGTAKP